LSEKLHLITFSEIATKFLRSHGFEPYLCKTEDEARKNTEELISKKQWPCYFFDSDTAGEKDFEEFFTHNENLDKEKYDTIGIIRNEPIFDEDKLNAFVNGVQILRDQSHWTKNDLLNLYLNILPEFAHKETGKYLDGRM
jgi:hypothetical protein